MASAPATTFGALLRGHRLAAGLTQEDLAARAGISTRGLQDLERGARQTPRPETLRMLADALGLDAAARHELIAAVHSTPAALQPPGEPAVLASVPIPPTALVGRESMVAFACDLLRRPEIRLLTLTGAGGVGKTRLALAIAGERASDAHAEVAWVELAALQTPELVPGAVAQAVGVRVTDDRPPATVLTAAIAARRLLLVLDNCEHVLPAMPLVGELLARCPNLVVLATSRSRLRLRGERELPVAPLAVPSREGSPSLAVLAGVAAVRLFVERAQEVAPAFALTAATAAPVAAICQRLEGLPLALELAAARIKLLPPESLLARLEQRLPLLSGGARDLPRRQQTMHDAIAWSYDLLSPEEQALMRRLAVFAGGFTLEAAERVAGGEGEGGKGGKGEGTGGSTRDGEARIEDKLSKPSCPADSNVLSPLPPFPLSPSPVPSPFPPLPLSPSPATLDLLASLVEQSLLRAGVPHAGEPRFTFLETVREFALERLEASDEAESARRAHAAYFLDLAERAEPELTGPRQMAWLERLDLEHDNLRAVLGWATSRDDASAVAVRVAGALWRFWWMHGHYREGRSWLETALSGGGGSEAARAKALYGAGSLATEQGDHDRAGTLLEAALAAAKVSGERSTAALALTDLGSIARQRGAYDQAAALHQDALALRREAGDTRGIAVSLGNLGLTALHSGDYLRAEELLTAAATAFRDQGDGHSYITTISNLAHAAAFHGDFARARPLAEESLAGYRALGDRQGVADDLITLGLAVQGTGDRAAATALFSEALEHAQEIGYRLGEALALHRLGLAAAAAGDTPRALALLGASLDVVRATGDFDAMAGILEGLARVTAAVSPDDAAVLLGGAAMLRATIGAARPPAEDAAYQQAAATVREMLGTASFMAGVETGRVMTTEQAIDLALAVVARLS